MLHLPNYLLSRRLQLPEWAKIARVQSPNVSILLLVDSKGAYEEWKKLLDVSKWDQYWLEVAYQCAKMDLQMCIEQTEYDPRVAGKPAEFRFSNAKDYALVLYPVGRGQKAASKDREARQHYVRIRGRIPLA